MRRIRSKNMKPEMIVRKLVHSMGFRYRLHKRDLPGKPDLVFGPRKKIVFVHGCFWHQHTCRDGKIPQSRRDYWVPKLMRNVKRDADHQMVLENDGWEVLIVWECETRDLEILKQKLHSFLS